MRKRQCRGGVGCVCTVHDGGKYLHDDPAAFSCSMAVGKDKRGTLESITSSPHTQNRQLIISRPQYILQRKHWGIRLHTSQIKPSREGTEREMDMYSTASEWTHFLLREGGFSPGSRSSSACSCRSWWPQPDWACQTWLKCLQRKIV